MQTQSTHVNNSVREKSIAPPQKKNCNIFNYAKIISVKFCQFVASVYPHMITNSGRFTLLFNKIALIF